MDFCKINYLDFGNYTYYNYKVDAIKSQDCWKGYKPYNNLNLEGGVP